MNITRSLTHWGLYDFHVDDDRLVDVTPADCDPDPSDIGRNLIEGTYKKRVLTPAVRRGYLNGDQGKGRGTDDFVDMSWDEVIPMVADELMRVRSEHGNAAIYGGSYGWASAGRFHHAQSQLHRFLSCIGGYTGSRNAYSFAAAEVILPHVIGNYENLLKAPSSWQTIAGNTGLMVCFGGMPIRNSQITNGGMAKHIQRDAMQQAKTSGTRFINISPHKGDVIDELEADWYAIRPGTDTALMLGLAHEIISEDLHDKDFLENYCTGFDEVRRYILGETDGVAKTPAWASGITGIKDSDIRDLARDMTGSRTMISISWSLTRHQFGEQPYWMGIVLAALLGQIGQPGTGIGLGYGVENKVGKNVQKKRFGYLPQFPNPVGQSIPVSRIADMLENPGGTYRYDGKGYPYPDIRLIYWAGGNPFHHHQDLNRLRRAWQKPDTIICNEIAWNANALHADIVLPAASFLERNDIGGAPNEDVLVAMKQAIAPVGNSRSEFDIFSAIAEAMQVGELFTENKTERQWLQEVYETTAENNPGMPDFETFWHTGEYHFREPHAQTLFEDFRKNPEKNPRATPSGLITLSSKTMGHPTWQAPDEWLGNADNDEFQLISHQPATRLHSQYYPGETSQAALIDGCEPLQMNTLDAQKLGLADGEKVKVYNGRGAFLAGLRVTDQVMPGVLHIATGAWWQPDADGTCQAGNPNAVTPDIGTSDIAQGPSALSCLVRVCRP